MGRERECGFEKRLSVTIWRERPPLARSFATSFETFYLRPLLHARRSGDESATERAADGDTIFRW